MTDLSLKILAILEKKAPAENIYLRGREELANYSKKEIFARADELAQQGYLEIILQDSFIQLEGSLVNYFYEITQRGQDYLTMLQLKTG